MQPAPTADPVQQAIDRLREDPVFFVRTLFEDRNLLRYGSIEELEEEMIEHFFRGPQKRGVLALRGFGKTYLLVATYIAWRLFRDPDCKILLVSKTGNEAKKTLYMVRQWLDSVWFLQHLSPSLAPSNRDQTVCFDVAGSAESRTPSLTCVGIENQLPGLRAHVVIADDVETQGNTTTIEARTALDELVKEFAAISDYGQREIAYVGTYHHQESLYVKLSQRGYVFRSYPMVLPAPDEPTMGLSPILQARIDRGDQPGSICFPNRHDAGRVLEKQSEGRTFWLMQFVLCCTLGDSNLYPLRLSDLIVPDFEIDPRSAPARIRWGSTTGNGSSTKWQQGLPCLGFAGDAIHRPIMYSSDDFRPFQGTLMFVDPSGRGTDETAAAVVALLNGMLWLLALEAWTDGYSPATLSAIAHLARRTRCQRILTEPNFGGGMFSQLLRPAVQRLHVRPNTPAAPDFPDGWACAVEDADWSGGQKEARILGVLEPVMAQHRLVVNPATLQFDPARIGYSLQHQLVNLTRQKGALQHDDRIEALAGAVAAWADQLDIDPARAHADQLAQDRQAAIEEYLRKYGVDPAGNQWFTIPSAAARN
jgi:hypothetical protein